MPRGKNYVNNNKGVVVQSHKKKSPSMEACSYGAGCQRKDCIYRHDLDLPESKKSNDPCLSFLAGTCAFTAATCRKRHPPKAEVDRLLAKYSKVKCRFGDDCKTVNCLHMHPRDQQKTDPVAFLEQSAFPPLLYANKNTPVARDPVIPPGSAWRAAPVVVPFSQPPVHRQTHLNYQTMPQQQQQQQREQLVRNPMSVQTSAWFTGNPQEEDQSTEAQTMVNENADLNASSPMNHSPNFSANGQNNLNVNAKVWVPGVGFN